MEAVQFSSQSCPSELDLRTDEIADMVLFGTGAHHVLFIHLPVTELLFLILLHFRVGRSDCPPSWVTLLASHEFA